jgi:hypothetical protein
MKTEVDQKKFQRVTDHVALPAVAQLTGSDLATLAAPCAGCILQLRQRDISAGGRRIWCGATNHERLQMSDPRTKTWAQKQKSIHTERISYHMSAATVSLDQLLPATQAIVHLEER